VHGEDLHAPGQEDEQDRRSDPGGGGVTSLP
jgi:hypothetical protein